MSTSDHPPDAAPPQVGRKRDPSRDADILTATLDVLADVGPTRLTMDMVAARAGAGKATIYRRWPSKAELMIEAVLHMKRQMVDRDHLPDTGTLRGDLLGLFKPQSAEVGEWRVKVTSALASLVAQDPALADAVNAAVVHPWAEAHLTLMRRAAARGEIPASTDVETLAQVIPSLAAYRTLMQRKPFDLAFLVALVDTVVMPALCAAPRGAGARSTPDRPAPAARKPSPVPRRSKT